MTALKVRMWKDKAFLNGEFPTLRRISLELPGFKKFLNDSLLFEPSAKNIECLLKEDIEWQGEADAIKNQHIKRINAELEIVELKKTLDIKDPGDYEYGTKPFDHQAKAFLLSRDKEFYAYFMEMGTGKTKVVIDNAAYLFERKAIECLIIVAPNGVHSQWVREQIPTHMPKRIRTDSAIYRASDKGMLREVERIIKSQDSRLKIVSFNIEAFSNLKGTQYLTQLLKRFKCMLVIDESTRIKTPGSLRTKNALKLAELAKYRRIMSGAPVTKGYEDLYSQLKFLHPDVLGFNSFYTFRNYHCIMGGFESRQIVGYRPNAVKELESRIDTYCFRTTKKECLDLPDKIYINRYVELTPEQDELYSKIEDELAIDMRYLQEIKGRVDAGADREHDTALMSAITKMLRMQQVACGHFVIKDEATGELDLTELPSNRLEVLMECIEEAQGKVIVWSRFIHDLKRISARLSKDKIGHVTYHGEVLGKQREDNIDRFRNSPSCKVFLAQPASGGTGLNLAVADTVIYFSNDFNADTRWQSEDRAHRIGQKNNVTYIDLIAAKTIDEDILDSLKSKKNLADALLDDPRKFLKRS